jgi:hypothetical protein
MQTLDARSLRHLLSAGLAGVVIATLSGCGTPRVYEVYRLTSSESLSEAVSAVSDERLTAAQADLRQLAINARYLQPARSRLASMSAAPAPAGPSFGFDGSSSLHGCQPAHVAEFTGRSYSSLQLDGLLASASARPF